MESNLNANHIKIRIIKGSFIAGAHSQLKLIAFFGLIFLLHYRYAVAPLDKCVTGWQMWEILTHLNRPWINTKMSYLPGAGAVPSPLLLIIASIIFLASPQGQFMSNTGFCNPQDISPKYNWNNNGLVSFLCVP